MDNPAADAPPQTPPQTVQRMVLCGKNAYGDIEPVALDEQNRQITAPTSGVDQLVKASSTDPTAGYLSDKVDNATIEISSQALRVKPNGIGDTQIDSTRGESWTWTANQTFTDCNLILSTATGTKIGTATNQKIGFWNATPIVQPSGANQGALTDNTTGAVDGTLADVGAAFNQATLNNNFADVASRINALRQALVDAGLIKGSA